MCTRARAVRRTLGYLCSATLSAYDLFRDFFYLLVAVVKPWNFVVQFHSFILSLLLFLPFSLLLVFCVIDIVVGDVVVFVAPCERTRLHFLFHFFPLARTFRRLHHFPGDEH